MACLRCGVGNRAKARFCDGCGAPLGSAPASLPDPASDELKHVTVLFSDLEGSTELIAGHGPEEARQRLLPALRAMSDAVHAFGGTVNQVLGDGVMALFGAPVSQEDHAVRACCASLRMHELAKRLSPPARLRVGLASGTTLLTASRGGIGVAGAHRAFGEIIHVASRLQGIAPPGTTLCSSEVIRLAGAAVDAAPLGARQLRGLSGEQDIYELRGLHRDGSRFRAAVERGLSPFTGREAELAALHRCAGLDGSRAGPGTVAAIVGEAGIGKSRLAWELTQSLDPGVWQVLQAEAVSYGSNIPYVPAIRLLRSYFQLEERDPPNEAARKVGATLDGLPLVPQTGRSALLSLLDLPLSGGSKDWQALPPLRRRDALWDAVSSLLRAMVQRGPVLVLMEDLHWADEETLRLLDIAVGSVEGVLLLVTHRPAFEPAWERLTPTIIPLAPLPQASMERLAGAVLDGVDAGLRGDVLARAGGNPFFLEEMARAAARAMQAVNGAAVGLQAAIPDTVQAVLAARIDSLEPADKEVLQAASALGTRFSATTLHSLFPGCPAEDFASRLGRLGDAGLLRPPPGMDGEHGFAHALVQEVAYAGMPGARRRNLHASAVRALEALYPDRLLEQAEPLAYHAYRGEVWTAALLHSRRAGQRAASRSAYRDAAAFFEQAVHACERLPQTNAMLAEQIDIRLELRNALLPTAGIGRNLQHSQAAEDLAQRLGDPRRLAWATSLMARDLNMAGRPTEALAAAQRALGMVGDADLSCLTRFHIALAAYAQGDYPQTIAVLEPLVREVEGGDRLRHFGLPAPGALYFRGWLSWAKSRTGAFSEAETVLADMVVLAREADQPLGLTFTHLSRGFVLGAAGRLQEAEAELRISLELCQAWSFYGWFTNIASCLGHVLSRLGQDEEGTTLLQRATERTRASGILVSHGQELAWLAEAHRAAGRADQAVQTAGEAVEAARQHEERGNEALALFALGRAVLLQGAPPDETAERLRAALTLAERCGMAPLVAQCRDELNRIGQNAGGMSPGAARAESRRVLTAEL
jgi:class 3 adenylate cyclase